MCSERKASTPGIHSLPVPKDKSSLTGHLNSLRDIEEKLHSMFPSDYKKDYRTFRPLDERNMRLRLSRVRCRRRGKPTKPSDCQKPNSSSSARDGVQLTATHHENHLHTIPESVMSIDPALLLLNGPQPLDSTGSLSLSTPNKSPHSSASQKNASRSFTSEEDRRAPHNDARPVDPSPSTSADNYELEARLGNKYSGSYLNRINSILRYSSSESWRSSWSSFLSFASSKASIRPAEKATSKTSGDSRTVPGTEPGFDESRTSLSTEEKEMWDELINDPELAFGASGTSVPFEDSYTSLTHRPCCQLKLNLSSPRSLKPEPPPQCGICGFTVAHFFAIHCGLSGRELEILSRYPLAELDYNTQDNFGNTPLHFLAASHKASILRLLSFSDLGANVLTRNSRGENFVHVLNCEAFLISSGQRGFAHLFQWLGKKNFDFYQRNYESKDAVELILANCEKLYPQPPRQTIYDLPTIIRPGETVVHPASAIGSSFAVPGDFAHIRNAFAEPTEHLLTIRDIIDGCGDTPLISVVRHWKLKLLKLGA